MLCFLEFAPQRLSGMQRGTNRNACTGSRSVHTLHAPHGCTIPEPNMLSWNQSWLKQMSKIVKPTLKAVRGQVCILFSASRPHSPAEVPPPSSMGVYLLTALDLWGFLFTLRAVFSPCQVNTPSCWNRPRPCRGHAGVQVARTQPQGQKKDGSSTAYSEVKLPKMWPDYWWQIILYSDSNKYTVSWGVCSQKPHSFNTWHILHALTNNLLIMCKLEVTVNKSGWQKMEYWIFYCYLCI